MNKKRDRDWAIFLEMEELGFYKNNDISTSYDESLLTLHKMTNFKGILLLPINVDNKTIGFVLLGSYKPRDFTNNEINETKNIIKKIESELDI